MYRQALWMGRFKHQTPKRTLLWSTSRAVGCLNLGALSKTFKSKASTTKRYKDKQGRARYQGSDQLKQTQPLVLKILRSCPTEASEPLKRHLKHLRQYPPMFAGAVLKLRPLLRATKEEFTVPWLRGDKLLA